jgi:Acetyltransferase (GNAT) domain
MFESSGHPELSPFDGHWESFISSDIRANVFHHPGWIGTIADCYGYRPSVIAVLDAQRTIRAGLPVMETGSPLTGHRLTSLPFTDHCFPLYDGADSRQQLTDGLVDLLRSPDNPRTELRCELPEGPGIHASHQHVLHTVVLDPNSEAVFSRISSMHRRNVRAAEKKGVRIERGNGPEELEAFYRLHLQTRRRQGVPVQPRRFFSLLGERVLKPGLGFVVLAYKDTQCLAAAVFLHWQNTLTYKYGASTPDSWNLRPNNLLMWSAMRWGCENGYHWFDLGRTDLANSGLRAFKSGWGAMEEPLVYSSSHAGSSSTIVDIAMPLAHSVIRHSPPWVCRVTGELLYKHFG